MIFFFLNLQYVQNEIKSHSSENKSDTALSNSKNPVILKTFAYIKKRHNHKDKKRIEFTNIIFKKAL